MLLEKNSWMLNDKYEQMKKEEIRYERYKISTKNKILLIAYGTMARICQTAIDELEKDGISVGLFRPISLFPFPIKQIHDEVGKKNVSDVLVIEMSTAQMCEDVERAALGQKPISFYGRTGGIVPSPEEVVEQVKKLVDKRKPKTKKKKA